MLRNMKQPKLMVVTLALLAGCSREYPKPIGTPPAHILHGVSPMAGGATAVRPQLAVDETVPEFECEGWINGEPFKFPGDPNQLVVVDVWAGWCSVVRDTAPSLVELQKKYAEQPVSWISLTNGSKASAENLATEFGMTWPMGYSATNACIVNLGTFNQGAAVAGYEAKPTLYLVRGDGKVLWCDDHSRMQHRPPSEIQQELDAAIAAHLGEKGAT